MQKTLLILLISYLTIDNCQLLIAQDIHFSQYSAAPLLLNPSQTAKFDGDYRVGLNHRNQWSSFIKPFSTYSGFFDKRIKMTKLGDDYFGAGLILYSDKAGTAQFTTQSALLSVAYHKKANAKHLLSFGLQGGVMQKGLNNENLKFGNQYENVFFNPELSNKENFSANTIIYPELHAGLGWEYDLSDKFDLSVALSLFNITKPKESFLGMGDNELSRRMSLDLKAEYIYSEKITINPGILFSGQTKAFEYLVGSSLGYKLKSAPLLNIVGLMGLWYRSADAIVIVPGLLYNNYRFGLSYDINISSLNNASKGRGAVELSLIYIFNTHPKLGIKKSLPCKRL